MPAMSPCRRSTPSPRGVRFGMRPTLFGCGRFCRSFQACSCFRGVWCSGVSRPRSSTVRMASLPSSESPVMDKRLASFRAPQAATSLNFFRSMPPSFGTMRSKLVFRTFSSSRSSSRRASARVEGLARLANASLVSSSSSCLSMPSSTWKSLGTSSSSPAASSVSAGGSGGGGGAHSMARMLAALTANVLAALAAATCPAATHHGASSSSNG
mmetsp:Transcript_53884/g.172752  ORF Transcript_53884/g.172752 Transcript_53884/m.172752 type:complete len:212 (-) Transcript_53884:937-1572(-)